MLSKAAFDREWLYSQESQFLESYKTGEFTKVFIRESPSAYGIRSESHGACFGGGGGDGGGASKGSTARTARRPATQIRWTRATIPSSGTVH
jgi:hypothetical protein